MCTKKQFLSYSVCKFYIHLQSTANSQLLLEARCAWTLTSVISSTEFADGLDAVALRPSGGLCSTISYCQLRRREIRRQFAASPEMLFRKSSSSNWVWSKNFNCDASSFSSLHFELLEQQISIWIVWWSFESFLWWFDVDFQGLQLLMKFSHFKI